MIVLYESFLNSSFGHGLLIVALKKKAPIVAENARFKNEHSWQRNRYFLNIVHRIGNPATSNSEYLFSQQLQKIRAVAVVLHGASSFFHLRCGYIAGPVGNFLRTRNHQSLTFFNGLNV